MNLEKKKSNKKIIISSIIVAIVLIGVVGVTFALWNYSNVTKNQELISGNIYMKYTETNQINAQGMMPLDISKYYSGEHYIVNSSMTKEELASCESFFSDDHIGIFQGDETPRAFCKGTGTAQGGQVTFQEILDSASSSQVEEELGELIEKHVIIREFIPQPTETSTKIPYFEFNIEGKNDYSKDIWYEIVLSHGDPPEDEDRDTRIKDYLLRFRLVEVVDGKEKEIFTNRNYESLIKEKIWVDKVSAKTEEEIKRVYRLYMWIGNETTIGNTDGVDYNDATWKKVFASIKVNVNGDFTPKEIDYTEYFPPQPARCFETQEFEHNGDTEIMITNYDTDCGTDVVIPSTINGHKVTVIGSNSKGNNDEYIMPIASMLTDSFTSKKLTSVVIPNTVRTIGGYAFYENNLTKVEIPDSVEWIDNRAFEYNQLEIVTIGSGIKYIGHAAFSMEYGNYNLSKITINKACEEIKNIEVSSKDTTKYYPWLTYAPPYTSSGVTIYGSNGEVCDAFE